MEAAHYEVVDDAVLLRSTAYAGYYRLRIELAPPLADRPTRVEMLKWDAP